MKLSFDVLDFIYDEDIAPAFSITPGGGYYYHYYQDLLFKRAPFDAWMTANGKTFGAHEVGAMPADWRADHETVVQRAGGGSGTPVVTPPVIPVVTAPVTLTTVVERSQEHATVTVAGGPADAQYTVNCEVQIDLSDAPFVFFHQVAVGETVDQIAAALMADFNSGPHPHVRASVTGGVVTLTAQRGHMIHLLEHRIEPGVVAKLVPPATPLGTEPLGMVNQAAAAALGLTITPTVGGGNHGQAMFRLEVAGGATLNHNRVIQISYQTDAPGSVIHRTDVNVVAGMGTVDVYNAVTAALQGDPNILDGAAGSPIISTGPSEAGSSQFNFFRITVV